MNEMRLERKDPVEGPVSSVGQRLLRLQSQLVKPKELKGRTNSAVIGALLKRAIDEVTEEKLVVEAVQHSINS